MSLGTPFVRIAAALSILAGLSACAGDPPPPPGHVEPGPVRRTDESDPRTWLERFDDEATRADALTRLIQLYENALTADRGDRGGPHIKPYLDAVVEPLSLLCGAGDVDPKSRVRVVKLVADTRDPRAEPCLRKTLADYQVDVTEESVRDACRAVTALRLTSVAGPLLGVFDKLHASRPQAQLMYRDVHDAMIAVADPSWAGALVGHLGHPVDAKDTAAYTDEMFWQITSAELLGRLRHEAAVRPLLEVLLAPAKGPAHNDALVALVRIGKPSVVAATALLEGKGEKLAAPGAAPHVGVAVGALVLGAVGRAESKGPMIGALSTPDPVLRALVARELGKLPADVGTLAAFRGVLEKTPLSVTIPETRAPAHEVLAERATDFQDATVVPWLVEDARRLRGEAVDVQAAREAAFLTVLKLARADQVAHIDALAKLGKRGQTPGDTLKKELATTRALLKACGDRADCWMERLVEPAAQAPETQFQGIKSAYMIGVLADPSARTRLVGALSWLTNPAVRYVALTVIDRLSPRGDAATAAALQKMVDDDLASGNADRIRLGSSSKAVILRLGARAAP